MFLAGTTRCLLSTEFRQLKKLKHNLPNSGIIECETARDILEPQNARLYKHNTKTIPSETDGLVKLRPPPKPFLHSSPTEPSVCTDEPDNTHSSGYSVFTSCLGPFIDSRHWYAENKRPGGSVKKGGRLGKLEDADEGGFFHKINRTSLEHIKKMLRNKDLKKSEGPSSVQKE